MMTTETSIVIARDFTRTPGPRLISDGPFSGEKFFKKVLKPAFQKYSKIEVVLDGTEGFGSSFLDEAFRSLVVELELPPSVVLARLNIVSDEDEFYKEEAIDSINKAKH